MPRDVTAAMTLLLSVVIVTLLTVNGVDSFEYSGYCQKMCMWGRGGNLCKCNAVHFAGKRNYVPQSDVLGSRSSATASPDVLDLADDVNAVRDDVDSSGAAEQLRLWLARAALAVQDAPKDGQTQNGPSSDLFRAKQLLLMALKKLSDNAQASRQGNRSPWNDVTQDRIFNNI